MYSSSGCPDTPPSKIYGAIQDFVPECAADFGSMPVQCFLEKGGGKGMYGIRLEPSLTTKPTF